MSDLATQTNTASTPADTSIPVSAISHDLESRQGIEVPQRPAIVPRKRNEPDVLPLSYAQQRVWLTCQMHPETAVYNIPFGIRFRGRIDQHVLSRSVNEVIRRHEVLRTVFVLQDGLPVQKIVADLQLTIPEVDLRSTPASSRESEFLRLAKIEAEMPFALEAGPLLRMKLVRMADLEYRLVGSMHHLITDAWSIGVMLREFAQLYQAFGNGKGSPLPELPFQYADSCLWQRHWLQKVEECQIQYWRKQLADVAALDLLTDHPRSDGVDVRAATVSLRLSAPITKQLMELGRRQGTTLFMTLLTAFKILLSRYTQQSDVAVGTAIANRNNVETERLIGPFVNSVILRTDLSGNPTFIEALKRVKQQCLDAYKHQDVPFERLVQVLHPQRESVHNPFFQVMFTMQNTPARKLSLPGLEMEELTIESSTTQFDLFFLVQPSEAGLECTLVYRAALWEPESMRRLLGHWERLLNAVVSSPEEKIADLPMLQPGETKRLLVEWNTVDKRHQEESLPLTHQLFEAQVERRADSVAVVSENTRLTYGELNCRANQLANYLQQHCVGPESRVAVCLERSADVIVAILGVLKAGAAYVPIDPLYPSERINFMLRDSQAAVLITQEGFLPAITQVPHHIICLNQEWERLTNYAGENLPNHAVPANIAFVMYTSGSTGQPKGVMMCHGPLSQLLAWQNKELRPGAKTIQMASHSFDVSFQEIFSCLTSGQELILLSDDVRRDPEAIRQTIMREQADRIDVPCVVLHNVMATGGGLSWGETLREVISAGEKLEVTDELRQSFRCLPNARLHNHYGPTETHVMVSYTLPGNPADWDRYPPIGKPLPSAQVFIVDDNMHLMPIGIAGEVYIGGACLSRGYLNQPALTAEKFIPNPFAVNPGQRLYKTGDMARWLADGTIEFIGRRDYQVKVRGFRIELGEIEAALARHPAVDRAVVTVHEEKPGSKRLIAYMVPKPGQPQASVRVLRDHVKCILPEYMVPAGFVWLTEFPITRNGKIDRRRLTTAPAALEPEERGVPRSPIEEIVAGTWEAVLGLQGVSTTDNFFEIGGHSLLAAQVISRLRGIFAIDLPLRTIFESSTITELAQAIAKAGKSEAPIIRRMERQPGSEFPLSFAQERMWFLEQFAPGNSAYHIAIAARLEGVLDFEALEEALREVVRRHEVLRTVFVSPLGRPAQKIREKADAKIAVEELSAGQSDAEKLNAAKRILSEDAARPFDLENGPVMRALLLRLSAQEHIFQLTIHHIVMDGWSIRALIREIGELYGAEIEGRKHQLPGIPLQYADFALWQRECLGEKVLQQELTYWKTQLREARAAELQPDKSGDGPQVYQAAIRRQKIPAAGISALRRIAGQEGATLFMALFAGFQALLFRYTGENDLTIGVPIANRNRPEIEDLIGLFVNTVALRLRLNRENSFRELLRRVREVTLQAYSHQELPFEKLVDAMRKERDLAREPLFNIFFVVQNIPLPALEWGQLRMSAIDVETASAKFDLTLVLREAEDGMMVSAEYRRDLYKDTTIEHLLEDYEALLRYIAERPEKTLEELTSMIEGKRDHTALKAAQ